MAFGAVTILMDTLHQHFLLPAPRFPLRNKTKAKLLYKNLSSLQTRLEQDSEVCENNEAMKGLEAQVRDASVELRFHIEHQLRLFYLGKAMKLRLHSAQKLILILNWAIKNIEILDFDSMLDILRKHLALPVWRMPAHIKKRVNSFCTHHPLEPFLFCNQHIYHEQESKDEWETEEEQEDEYEQESEFEWETEEEQKRNVLYEAESIVRQELRSSYLNKYMKQRIHATHRIRQFFMLGIKLTSYFKKEQLKVKNARDQSKNSQNNNTASLRGLELGDSLQQHTSESTIKMVGCDDEFNTIMDNLNHRSSKREIVSIVGMGGIGKTTLARKIYEDASFISRFDCRACVTISQEYNPRQVFQTLLSYLAPEVKKNNEASKDELAMQVYQCLKGQRYVIVIDDLWNTDFWDDLMRCFPDDSNGSRLLLTTRLKNVADYAASSSHFCHNKQFLGSYEGWNLFCSKVSKRIILSPEFEIIARRIVEKCKGLPLAITVAAGLISNSNQTFNEWEHIAKNVATLSLDHSNEQCENIIHLSYTFLPHHLKLCFLSFGCSPANQVDEDMIVDFWVSEGFLKVMRSKSLEDVARGNLQDLVDRNLLICGFGWKNDKFYSMHDVLRELAVREAQKENLLGFMDGSNIGLRFKRIQPKNSSSISQPLMSTLSRICSYNGITYTSNTSLLTIGYPRITTRWVPAHFKFLRALAVGEIIDVHNIFLEITGLVHLKWLNIHCSLNLHSLPLFMLWNLQKLEFHGSSTCEPLDIWGLPQLRNLHIDYAVTLVPPRSIHHNLESISILDYRSCTKELFMRIPNLRTLEVGIADTINPKCKAPNWFESLAYLYNLEELVVKHRRLSRGFTSIHSMGMSSLEIFFPNLKKLKLWNTKLKWKDVDVVGTLPKLEVLELIYCDFFGRIWEPKDGGFHHLKFLKIYGGDLFCWEATSDHFPVLECLVLNLKSLKEVPSDFANIATLKSIKVYKCSEESLALSVERIQEEQQEYGNDAFVVDIFRR